MTTGKAYMDLVNSLKAIYEDREADNISDWVFENVTGLKKMGKKRKQK